MAKRFFWVFFFIICMLLGYFHGSNPDFSKSAIIAPKKVGIFSTHEKFFPKEVRELLEKKFNVIFVYKVETNWDQLLATLISKESADIILAPSYWLNSLYKQNLLYNIPSTAPQLFQPVSSDFINKSTASKGNYIPLFWLKTGFQTPPNQDFKTFLNNQTQSDLFLLNEEDLLAAHITQWKSANLLPLVKSKKILLEDVATLSNFESSGLREIAISENSATEDPLLQSALLIYGAAINQDTPNKELLIEILKEYSKNEYQLQILKETRFNTCLENLENSTELAEQKKASFIRKLRLNNTIILDQKNIEAQKIIGEL